MEPSVKPMPPETENPNHSIKIPYSKSKILWFYIFLFGVLFLSLQMIAHPEDFRKSPTFIFWIGVWGAIASPYAAISMARHFIKKQSPLIIGQTELIDNIRPNGVGSILYSDIKSYQFLKDGFRKSGVRLKLNSPEKYIERSSWPQRVLNFVVYCQFKPKNSVDLPTVHLDCTPGYLANRIRERGIPFNEDG